MKTAEYYWHYFSDRSTNTITEEQFRLAIIKCQQEEHDRIINPIKTQIQIFNKIIECVENRCMACDGPVSQTLREITEDELSSLWHTLQNISKVINPSTKGL